jgi:membrane protease YdiL (CAAX protease family)
MAEEIMMSSLPDCASPPLAPMPSASAPAALPPPQSRPPRTWYFIGTSLFGLGVFIFQFLGQIATFVALLLWAPHGPATTPEQLRALAHDGSWQAVAVIIGCPLTLAALWVPIRIARQGFFDYLALRWPNRGEVVAGLAMLGALLLVWFVLRLAFGQTMPVYMIETYQSARADGHLVAFAIALCVLGPIWEEAFVRGFLFQGWSKSFLGTAGTIVLSSALWAALHVQYNAFYITQIFVLGLLLGYLRHRSGSTWLTVILHAANNVFALIRVALAVG